MTHSSLLRALPSVLRDVLIASSAIALCACGEVATSTPSTPGEPAAPAAPTINAPSRNGMEGARVDVGNVADTAGTAGTADTADTAGIADAADAADATGAADAAEIPVEERSGTTFGGAFVVSWVPEPDPIPFNAPFRLKVCVARAATPQTPERSARLELDATMPSHGHGMNRTPRVTANGDGTFLVEGLLFHMSGRWDLLFQVHSGRDFGQAILHFDLP